MISADTFMQKWHFLQHYPLKGLKGNVVNRTRHSSTGGSIKITLAVPLRKVKKDVVKMDMRT